MDKFTPPPLKKAFTPVGLGLAVKHTYTVTYESAKQHLLIHNILNILLLYVQEFWSIFCSEYTMKIGHTVLERIDNNDEISDTMINTQISLTDKYPIPETRNA